MADRKLPFAAGNRAMAFDPTTAFPLDARTYFESYADALSAAQSAKEVGSKETVYHYGMKLLVYENDTYTWYQITKDNTLVVDGTTVSPRPQVVESEAKMNEILSNATEASIGTVYKYEGELSNTYEQGALYILSGEIPDGDNVRYR